VDSTTRQVKSSPRRRSAGAPRRRSAGAPRAKLMVLVFVNNQQSKWCGGWRRRGRREVVEEGDGVGCNAADFSLRRSQLFALCINPYPATQPHRLQYEFPKCTYLMVCLSLCLLGLLSICFLRPSPFFSRPIGGATRYCPEEAGETRVSPWQNQNHTTHPLSTSKIYIHTYTGSG